MARRFLFEITPELTPQQRMLAGTAIGYIQPHDMGKLVYDNNGTVQVENQEQRDERIADPNYPKMVAHVEVIRELRELTKKKLELLDEMELALMLGRRKK